MLFLVLFLLTTLLRCPVTMSFSAIPSFMLDKSILPRYLCSKTCDITLSVAAYRSLSFPRLYMIIQQVLDSEECHQRKTKQRAEHLQ